MGVLSATLLYTCPSAYTSNSSLPVHVPCITNHDLLPVTGVLSEQIMGRRMARCVIEKAGLARFWGNEHRPPKNVLKRALSYVETLVDVMEGIDSVINLLQGETMATLLKNIGKTLSKQPQQELALPESAATDAQQGMLAVATSAAAAGNNSVLQDEKLQALRSLLVLMHLLEAYIGSHAFQVNNC